MKFTIREMMLVTLVAAVALGWTVDRWQATARDEHWKICFFRALDVLSSSGPQPRELDTPDGVVRINLLPERGK